MVHSGILFQGYLPYHQVPTFVTSSQRPQLPALLSPSHIMLGNGASGYELEEEDTNMWPKTLG